MNIEDQDIAIVRTISQKKTDDKEKILYIDAKNCYSWDMGEPLPYDEINFDRNVELEHILKTPGDTDFGYFVAIDLKCPE